MVAGMVALAGLRRLPCTEDRPGTTDHKQRCSCSLRAGTRAHASAGSWGCPRTVKVHLGRIYAKLDARDRLSAVLAAYNLGLIPPRSDEALHSIPTR